MKDTTSTILVISTKGPHLPPETHEHIGRILILDELDAPDGCGWLKLPPFVTIKEPLSLYHVDHRFQLIKLEQRQLEGVSHYLDLKVDGTAVEKPITEHPQYDQLAKKYDLPPGPTGTVGCSCVGAAGTPGEPGGTVQWTSFGARLCRIVGGEHNSEWFDTEMAAWGNWREINHLYPSLP